MRTANELLQESVNAIEAIPLSGISEAVELLFECKGKVVISGMGKAGLVGKKISATLSSTGTPSFFLHPSEAQHGDLGMLSDGDILIAISNSGKTREILETVILSKNLIEDIGVITITSNPESDLALLSDVIVETGAYPELCPLGMAPTSSTTAMIVIGDIIAMLLMEKKEFGKQSFYLRHHSGYLGSQLKKELAYQRRLLNETSD